MSTFNPFADPIGPRESVLPSRRHSMDREQDAEDEASKNERGPERIRGNFTTAASRRNAPSVTGALARK